MPESTPGPIDRAAIRNLLTMFNGDVAFLNQVIDTYLADATNLLQNIRQATANGQAQELQRAAHSLKSNSANLGATRLSAYGKELEDLGKNGSTAVSAARLADLETEFQQVSTILQHIRANGL